MDAQAISLRLSREETNRLIERGAVEAYLLAALAEAWQAWNGQTEWGVELESHGARKSRAWT
jgi:hypothetical protein